MNNMENLFIRYFKQATREEMQRGVEAKYDRTSMQAIQRMFENHCENWQDFQFFALGMVIAEFIQERGWGNEQVN